MISSLCRDKSLTWAAALLLCAASPAGAVVLFLDLGGTATGVQGGPLDFSNPVVYAVPGEILTLHVWAIPDADDQKSVVALGHNIAAGGPDGGLISVVQYVLDNPTLGAGTRWDGVNLIGSFNGGGLLVSDARAVFVPLTARPAGGIGSGHAALDPGYDAASGAVHIAQLDIAVDEAAKPGGIAELRLEVGPLTIAHATAGTWAAEPVFFGFVPGGPEAATGSGAQAGATSVAADATIIVADECAGVADCADADDNGVRDEPCTWWACEAGHCAGSAVSFGDVGGEFGACPPDGAADANDRFHALNCFANQNAMGASGYPCEAAPPAAFNVDAGGPFGDCNPDGVCDGHDAFHALNAFDGTTSCSCPAPSPAPPAAGSRHEKRQAR